MRIEEARALFPVVEKRSYLIGGSVTPANSRSLEVMREYVDILANDPLGTYPGIPDAVVAVEDVRGLFARLMHADAEEIAITESASAASNIAVDLIEPTPGGNVVFDEFNYASSVFPWLIPPRDKVERRCVQARDEVIHPDDIAKAIDDRTIAVSVTHVSAFEGFKHNICELAELAHAHGAVLLVDGTQAAGEMEIDLHASGVDFYATAALKWLLGTAGVGFLYVSKQNLSRLPTRAGWRSAGGFDWTSFGFVPTAQRYELGMPPLMGLAFTKPGLEILLETGVDQIESHVSDLAGYCIDGMQDRGMNVVTPRDSAYRHGIIAAYLPEAIQLWSELREQGVDTCAVHLQGPIADRRNGDLFRVDPGLYNNRGDIDRFLEGVDAFFAKRRA
jgi:selenocysteine lyase/cysteine desulfurase